MRILVINPPSSDRHDTNSGKESLSFPLGLAYIVTVIKKNVDESNVYLVDINSQREFLDFNVFKEELQKISKPNIVFIGGMSTVYYWIKNICKCVKEIFPDTIIICGGSVTFNPERLLNNTEIDIAVVGEGEKIVEELLIAIKNQENLEHIKGICFKKGSAIIKNEMRPRIENLDSIAFPDYHFFDTERYILSEVRMTGYRSLPMIISRGCPFNCNFCFRNFGHEIRYRSVDNVVEEIKILKNEFDLDYIVLWDELPLFNKEWIKTFALALKSNSMRISWTCACRTSFIKESDLEFLKQLKSAGLKRISFGIESGSNEMLKRMNKGVTIEHAERALRTTRKAGIKATGTFMIGYPGESSDTIKKTADFCKKNLLKTTFYICMALPGSNLYDDCIEKGIIRDEEQFLYTLSKRGDASQLNINLTDMSDENLLLYKHNAENDINRFQLFYHFKYYGFARGIFNLIKNSLMYTRRKLKGTYFDTP